MIQLLILCTKIMGITFDLQNKFLSQILLFSVFNAIIGNNVLFFQSRTRKFSWKDEVGHNETQTNPRSDYKRDSWDKELRNMNYSFICMSVVPQFQGMVDFIIEGSFPRSRRRWLTEQETCGEIHRPITHSPRFPPIDTRFFDTNNK